MVAGLLCRQGHQDTAACGGSHGILKGEADRNDRTDRHQRLRAHRPQLPAGGPAPWVPMWRWWRSTISPRRRPWPTSSRYDSTHGRFDSAVEVVDSSIVLDTGPITVLAERDPKALPWDDLGVDVVIESTGLFTTRESAASHLEAGATRVIVSAPATDVDATFVVGVNDSEFDPGQGFRRLQRLLHHQLLRPHGEGARRRLRGRERDDDHRPRLHQRPEPARPPAQGSAAGPGRGRQHHPRLHRGGPGHRAGPAVDEGPAGRQRPPGPGSRRLDHRLHRRDPRVGHRGPGQRGVRRRRHRRARWPRCSTTPRIRSSRRTSSAARPRAPSTPS